MLLALMIDCNGKLIALGNEPDYHFLRYFAEKVKLAMTDVDEKWIVQQMIEIQAPKAFKKLSQSVNDLVSVGNIISKDDKINKKENKVPRSKRPSTRKDLQ